MALSEAPDARDARGIRHQLPTVVGLALAAPEPHGNSDEDQGDAAYWHANGTSMIDGWMGGSPGPGRISPGLGFVLGAGDENRTRTVSLGRTRQPSRAGPAGSAPCR